MTRRNVVVTGLGAVTALGLDAESTFAALLSGRSGVGTAPATAEAASAVAASVSEKITERIPQAEAEFDRATQLGLAAAREAVADAQLVPHDAEGTRIGVFVGIGMGGAHAFEGTVRRVHQDDNRRKSVHPLSVIRMMPNAIAAWLCIESGFRGPSSTYSVACASSAVALGEAFRCIQHGYADAIVVVGAEAQLTRTSFASWSAMRVLATPDAAALEASHKPFDMRRSGFVLAEGAAALVLESESSAGRRHQRAYARMAGYGSTTDACHITKPSSLGQADAMARALTDSGLPASEVGYINAHGTATRVGDVTETQAIRAAFGAHSSRVAVSSTKSMHGHLIGASGALELLIGIKAMNTGSIPPTANLTQPDPRCDLDFVPLFARHRQRLSAVMSNSFAFGGCNVSLVVTHPAH